MLTTSDNLIKINGEYVRFYASTNSALPELMRNTGAMIVLQDNSYESYYRRSLYLANNFIAGGYGVKDEDARNYLEEISYLRSDGSRQLSYELNNIRENIITVENTFNAYVRLDGGDISNTLIEIPNNGNPIHVRAYEFSRMLVPAEYEDIKITNFSACVTYEMDVVTNFNNISNSLSQKYYSYVYIDDNTINKDDVDIKFKVPLGSLITNIKYEFISYNGSTNGFNLTQSDYVDIENISKELRHTTIDRFSKTLILEGDEKISITEDNGVMLSNNRNFPIPFGYVTTSGSVIYNDYPLIKQEYGTSITSYENIIKEYTKSFAPFSYVGTPIIKYALTDNVLTNSLSIYNDKWNYINDNKCNIISDGEYSYIYLCVPTNYDILGCNIKRSYNRLNNTSYYIYNITGDIYEIDNTEYDNILVKNMYITKNFVVPCRQYVMRYDIHINDEIIIDLFNIDAKNPIEKVESSEYFNQQFIQNELICSSYFIQNSEFNSNHWFNPDELYYIQRN